jgi:hypothetical protein
VAGDSGAACGGDAGSDVAEGEGGGDEVEGALWSSVTATASLSAARSLPDGITMRTAKNAPTMRWMIREAANAAR